jgi:hypothetical protein
METYDYICCRAPLGWLSQIGEFEVAAISGGRSALSSGRLAELSRAVSNA